MSMKAWKPNKFTKSALTAAATGGLLLISPAAFAQTTTPVDDLETEMAKLTDIYDNVVPVAVGAAAFGIGMILIKRIAFS